MSAIIFRAIFKFFRGIFRMCRKDPEEDPAVTAIIEESQVEAPTEEVTE